MKTMREKYKYLYNGIAIFLMLVLCLLGYQISIFFQYTLDRPDNVEDIVKGLHIQKTFIIHRQSILEEEYLIVGHFKMKNEFTDYIVQEKNSELEPTIYKKELTDKTYSISFASEENNYQMIDMFAGDEATFFGTTKGMEKKYNSTNRKEFLEKNQIHNDVDFYRFVEKHYYIQNHLWMSRKTMMENYAFNAFVSIAVPKVDSLYVVKGDYDGFIMRLGSITQVTLIYNGRRFGFLTNDERFLDNDYLITILKTIEISS